MDAYDLIYRLHDLIEKYGNKSVTINGNKVKVEYDKEKDTFVLQ